MHHKIFPKNVMNFPQFQPIISENWTKLGSKNVIKFTKGFINYQYFITFFVTIMTVFVI